MVTIYVTSLEKGTGKTTLCVGLGKRFLRDGKKIGFFKPIITGNEPVEDSKSDALFIKQVFALKESVESLCPVFTDKVNLASKIKQAFNHISKEKDVIVVEGIDERSQDYSGILEALNAKVIVVEGYSGKLLEAHLKNTSKHFGGYLLGLILNKVPRNQVERVRSDKSVLFSKTGVRLLGILPETRTLIAISIGQLAEQIQGEILNSPEKSTELVESLMLGAFCVDPGPTYFNRKNNKAAVIRSDRPDMQLAALETSTRCLVLSGNTPPNLTVLNRAEEKKIPIILTKKDVSSIVTSIEDAMTKAKFNQENKLPNLAEIMEQGFNFDALYQELGLIK